MPQQNECALNRCLRHAHTKCTTYGSMFDTQRPATANSQSHEHWSMAQHMQDSHSLAYKEFQDFPGPPERFSRTLS